VKSDSCHHKLYIENYSDFSEILYFEDGGYFHLKILEQVNSDSYLSNITILYMNLKLNFIDFLKKIVCCTKDLFLP
jgi:hypothetical protein